MGSKAFCGKRKGKPGLPCSARFEPLRSSMIWACRSYNTRMKTMQAIDQIRAAKAKAAAVGLEGMLSAVPAKPIEKKMLAHPSDRVFLLLNVLSPEECDLFIRVTEGQGFESAPVTTGRGFMMIPELRNNGRVMVDDPLRAAWLWGRVWRYVDEHYGSFHAVGLNERFRYYRYEPGEYFKWHGDGAFIRSENERSLYTLLIYLNDDCEGGTTDFRGGLSVKPVRGAALVFEHGLIHQGAEVISGKKYVMRSDVMYRRSDD